MSANENKLARQVNKANEKLNIEIEMEMEVEMEMKIGGRRGAVQAKPKLKSCLHRKNPIRS